MSYSPSKRTGLVFCGTGTHGVYQAGVLRALHEAGVKIDVVAGHGVGAATAMLAAIDGGAKLCDEAGLWLSPPARRYYRWRRHLRLVAYLSVLLAASFAIPVLVLALSAAVYAAGFVLTLVGLDAGPTLIAWVSTRTMEAFAVSSLPVLVPRLVALVVLAMAVTLSIGLFASLRRAREGMDRVARGRWWWRLVSSPLDVEPLRAAVSRVVWDLVRGAATTTKPSPVAFSRRYGEALGENLGQPGCRELVLGVTDLDARRDIVGALLREPFREKFFASRPGRERGAEVVDLAADGRDMMADLLGAALTPSIGSDAHPLRFPSDGYWGGETHRGCDRPGILARLLAELDTAGVVQVIVVSAAAPPAPPHQLRAPAVDPRARLGEYLASAEAAALQDAVTAAGDHFDAVYVIAPAHNAVGPFDLAGAYDGGSDRRFALAELQRQGYRDGHEQFIDPVVGASGEQLAPAIS